MFTNHGYAVLIGVDDYRAFDASRESPLGKSDLAGSRNDVRAFWRQCRALGMKPANVRVLASPPIDFHELEGASSENVGPATEAEILSKARWLAEKLGQKDRPTGLLTFSGHGDHLAGQGDVVCPSDVAWEKRGDGAELVHAVSVRAIHEIFARNGAASALTVVLDTCHGGAAVGPAPADKALTLTGGATLTAEAGHDGRGEDPPGEPFAGRVLRASKRGQVAYQTKLDGRYRGLFSWAVSTTMEQWRATQEGDTVRLDLAYGKLVETAGRLMSALWFDQTPELSGPEGVVDLAVFQQGTTAQAGATTEKPNGAFLTEQLDGGLKVWRSILMVDSGTGNAVATVYIFNQAIGTFVTGKEYWYVNNNELTNLGSSSLNIGVTDSSSTTAPGDPGYSPEQKFQQSQSPGWGTGHTSDPWSGGCLFAGPNGCYLRLELVTGTPPTVSYVIWYQVLSSGTPANFNPAGTWTATSGSVPVPSGSTLYGIRQATS